MTEHDHQGASNRLAELQKNRMRERIIAAYEAYARREPASADNLFQIVYEFALRKHSKLAFDYPEDGETPEDSAQEVSIKVWQWLKENEFNGTGENFYSWLNNISFHERADLAEDLGKRTRRKTAVTVSKTDDDGETREIDNPEFYKKVINEDSFTIPNSVTGVDLSICHFILAKKSYAEIGEILNIAEDTIKQRLARLRKKLIPQREQETEQYAQRRAAYAELARKVTGQR